MVAGLGPILGEGPLGYFIDPLNTATLWEYRAGASWSGGQVAQRVDVPYTLLKSAPRVAVLVDNAVASSGEAAFIAFRGRANTRSFGTATCGLSTANSAFTLKNGASLNLTVAVMADRNKTPFGDTIAANATTPAPTRNTVDGSGTVANVRLLTVGKGKRSGLVCIAEIENDVIGPLSERTPKNPAGGLPTTSTLKLLLAVVAMMRIVCPPRKLLSKSVAKKFPPTPNTGGENVSKVIRSSSLFVDSHDFVGSPGSGIRKNPSAEDDETVY
jgi:hypothetical protein